MKQIKVNVKRIIKIANALCPKKPKANLKNSCTLNLTNKDIKRYIENGVFDKEAKHIRRCSKCLKKISEFYHA